jgi:PAS domain S-box-containing protein
MKHTQIPPELKITTLYIVVGGLWILLSDKLAALLFTNVPLSMIEAYKGWFYIAVTASLLYYLIKKNGTPHENINQNYEDIFRSAEEGIFRSSPEGRFILVNPALAGMFGYSSPEEMIETVQDINKQVYFNPANREQFMQLMKQHGVVHQHETQNVRKDKSVIWTSTNAHVVHDKDGNIKYYEGFVTDITQQKKTEEINKLSEARYHMLVEHASDGILITDGLGNLLDINKQACIMLGYEKEELLSKNLLDLISKEEAVIRPLKLHELRAGRIIKAERVFLQKSGGYLPVELNSKALPDGSLINIARDISHRRVLQEVLSRSEKRFRSLIENSMDVIALFSPEGKIIYQSPAAVDILGYSLDELIGKNVFEFILEEDKENAYKVLASLLNAPGSKLRIETRFLHKDGSIRWLDVMGTNRLNEPGVEAIVANYRDVTTRKNADYILERQIAELTILHSVALVETTSKSIDELILSATKIISETLHPDNCGVLLLNEEGNALTPHFSYFGTNNEAVLNAIPITMGVCGRVIQTGKSIRINETFQNEFYVKSSEGIHSELCVPISIDSKVVGVLNIESKTRDAYTETDERLLNTIAGGLANAIERLQLFEHEKKLHKQAETLREATAALTESLDIEVIYEKILSVGAVLVEYTSASIELTNGNYIEIVAQRGLPDDFDYIGKPYELKPEKWNKDIWLPVIIPDAQNDTRFVKFPKTEYIRSWMGIPLIAQGKLIGFLNFDSDKVNFFKEEDAALLQTFANQAAVAIDNSKHFEQESRRARIIEAIVDIANETTAHHDTKLVLNKIAQRALELLNANNVAVYLLQADNETIKAVSSYGIYSEELLADTIKLHEGITGNLIAAGKAEIINSTSMDARRINVPGTPGETDGNETMMSAPLILHGKCVGAINVWRPIHHGFFSQMELDFLISIAHQTSIALEASHLLDDAIRNAQETSAIAEVGRNISSTLQLAVVLERIAFHAKNLLNAETSAIYLSDPSNNTLTAIAALGTDSDEIKNDPVVIGRGILGNIAEQGRGEIVNNTEKDPRTLIIKGTQSRAFEHIMGVPILSKNILTGLLVVWRQGETLEFHRSDLGFLTRLAQQAAIAIENARLFEAEQHRRKEADILREATIALTANTTLQQIYQITLDSLAKLIAHDRATLELINRSTDESNHTHQVVATRNFQINTIGDKYVINYDMWGGIDRVKRPLIVNNIPADERFKQFNGLQGTLSWMGIPLIVNDRLIGYLSLDSENLEYFNEEHVAIAQTLANQAATAIENARLFESEKKRRRDAEILSQATGALTNSMEINDLFETILDWLNIISPYDSVSITLKRQDVFEIVASRGLPEHTDFSNVHFPINETWTKIANTHQPLQIHDAQKDPRFEKLAGTEYIHGWMGVPMFTQNALIGFINLDSNTPGAFDDNEQAAAVQIFANQAATAIDKTRLLENLQLSNQELYLAYDITLEGWGKALELRDKETQGHTQRVTDLTLKLAQQMNISESELIHIRRGVLMHDIGKMGIPDSILHKKGPLTESEREEMRKHTQYAYDLINPITYLRSAIDIAYNHHEWWDGNGYPRKLKGEEIPLSARIFAIIDVWDALLSDRPYRKAWPRKKVIQYIQDLSGKQFDPNVVAEFFKMIDEEEATAKKKPVKKR